MLKAHRTKKEKRETSSFEQFVTEGNVKVDELAKEGAMLDEGFMAVVRAEAMQQEREEIYAALQTCGQISLFIGRMEGLPKSSDDHLWKNIWEELHLLVSKEFLVEVEHVKAHRTKEGQKRCQTLRGLRDSLLKRQRQSCRSQSLFGERMDRL